MTTETTETIIARHANNDPSAIFDGSRVWFYDADGSCAGSELAEDIESAQGLAAVWTGKEPATLKPVALSGWYERTDGTIGEYTWRNGFPKCIRSVPSWGKVPSVQDDLDSYDRDHAE